MHNRMLCILNAPATTSLVGAYRAYDMTHTQTAARSTLIAFSLIATYLFLLGMGSGIGAILFAASGTLTQLAALIWLPGVVSSSWREGRLLVAVAAGAALLTVILISVTGSVSILSGLVDEQQQASSHRTALESLMSAKQESADRLINLDRITKAQPFLSEVAGLRAELATLPAPSGFYLAAQRIGGQHAGAVVTVIIVALSLLLDTVTLLLGIDTRASRAVTPARSTEVIESEPVTHRAETVTREYHSDPELVAVRSAIESGEMKTASVRTVRNFLGCSQTRAVEIARQHRETQEPVAFL